MQIDGLLHEYTGSVFLMGLTIYREAANQPTDGQVAVAHVIMTRAKHGGWEGENPYEVITKREQFSSITHLGDPMTVVFPKLIDRVFQRCLQIALEVYEGSLPNPVPGADHYCTAAVAAKTKWADETKFLKQIGAHRFYRLDGDPAAVKAA
jgi:spore germination cell wall hydrolase CwlJ-like protein